MLALLSRVGLRPLSTHLDEAPAVREPLPLPEPPAPPVHAGPPLGGQALRWKVPAPPVLGHRVADGIDVSVPKSASQVLGRHDVRSDVDPSGPLLPREGSYQSLQLAACTPSLVFRWALLGPSYMAHLHTCAVSPSLPVQPVLPVQPLVPALLPSPGSLAVARAPEFFDIHTVVGDDASSWVTVSSRWLSDSESSDDEDMRLYGPPTA